MRLFTPCRFKCGFSIHAVNGLLDVFDSWRYRSESLLCIWTLGSTIVNYISHVYLHGKAGVLYFSGFPTWGIGTPTIGC